MSTLMFNTDPPVYADRLRTRHVVIVAVYNPQRFEGGTLSRSIALATLLNINHDRQRLAERIAPLHLPANTSALWVENA